MKIRENKNKALFSVILLGRRENEEKENNKLFFLLFGWREK